MIDPDDRRERRGRASRGAPRIGIDVGSILEVSFYDRPAELVARDLLGSLLVSEIDGAHAVGRIVETEAYTGPDDDASHASARIGRTPRNAAMFGHAGRAYIYLIYGMHWCLNVVTGAEGHPAAVLIRAAEALEGIETMTARRPGVRREYLMRGPGNLCRALGVAGSQNTHPLLQEPLLLRAGERVPERDIARGPRVGITRAADLPLRYWIATSPSVSRRPSR